MASIWANIFFTRTTFNKQYHFWKLFQLQIIKVQSHLKLKEIQCVCVCVCVCVCSCRLNKEIPLSWFSSVYWSLFFVKHCHSKSECPSYHCFDVPCETQINISTKPQVITETAIVFNNILKGYFIFGIFSIQCTVKFLWRPPLGMSRCGLISEVDSKNNRYNKKAKVALNRSTGTEVYSNSFAQNM